MKICIPNKLIDFKNNISNIDLNLNIPNRNIKYKIPTQHIKAEQDFLFIPDNVFELSTGLTFEVSYIDNTKDTLHYPDKYRCQYSKKKPVLKGNSSLLKINKDVIYNNTQEDKELIMSVLDSMYNTTLNIPDDYLGNKNLIYFSVAKSEGYLDLLELALISIHKNNRIKNFDVLIITTESFKQLLLQKPIASKFNLLFHIIEEPEDGIKASMSKLDVFDYPLLFNYRNILFLDCDIICINEINTLFSTKLTTNKLLTVSNPSVPITSHNSIYHGLDIDDPDCLSNIIENKQMPFNAGQFMFKNSAQMKQHFENIKWFASVWPGKFFFEQCFMNRYFCGYNLTDNNTLKDWFVITSSLVGNTQHKVHYDNTMFIHFTAPPLNAEAKLTFITDYCDAHQLSI